MPLWLEPVSPEDVVFEYERVYDVLHSRENFIRGHQPLAVVNNHRQIRGVVWISDMLAYVAMQTEVVHHLWPSFTAVVPEVSWPLLRQSVVAMPMSQFTGSRRGIIFLPTTWAHAVRLLSRSSRTVLYVQDRRRLLIGKITWTSLWRYRNLLEENYGENVLEMGALRLAPNHFSQDSTEKS